MIHRHVSDEWNLGVKGHVNFDFIDVKVDDDNLLFIDPTLIELFYDDWGIEARKTIESFFDNFFAAYYEKDEDRKYYLLSHAHERNATKLGYGNGMNGTGNTPEGLLDKFKYLDSLVKKIETIEKAQDLPLFINGFGQDGLSDLLTNILQLLLSDFTISQMEKRGIPSNGTTTFYAWNRHTDKWEKHTRPAYFLHDSEDDNLLLVPKEIVRDHYLPSISQFFNRIIVERLREKGEYKDVYGNNISKSVIIKRLKNPRNRHWLYDEAVRQTIDDNEALFIYHDRLKGYYIDRGGAMSDERLDDAVNKM